MNLAELKALIGKTVFLDGTGNNRKRGGPTPILRGVIKSVGRVNVRIEIDGMREGKFRFNLSYGNSKKPHLDEGYNSGYYLYASYKDVEDHKEAMRLSSLISASYRHASCYSILGLDKVKKIADILEIS